MIQIGMSCSPDWLCDMIAWGFGLLFVVIVISVVREIIRSR